MTYSLACPYWKTSGFCPCAQALLQVSLLVLRKVILLALSGRSNKASPGLRLTNG